MKKEDLYHHIFESKMFSQWHWFRWHFEHRLRGSNHPFAESIVNACLDCTAYIPNFGFDFMDQLSAISGQEKWLPHWEQLNQKLSELLIIRQIVTFNWPSGNTYEWEEKIICDGKKPELLIQTKQLTFGIEVKAPMIFEHQKHRAENSLQGISRSLEKENLKRFAGSDKEVTLPRDNPVKDFLLSANLKFESFKKKDNQAFISILVIVWDDFINEPLSALTHPDSGLLTSNSFAKTKESCVISS